MISIRELSASLGVAFGTSGVRGLVSSLTPSLCYAYAKAFLQSVCANSERKTIALAMDLRPSSPDIVKACCQAIEDSGYQVVFCGAVPTPTLAFYAMSENIPCIMVTGSHIPFDRNGIKFYRADGEITKADEAAIMNEVLSLPPELEKKIEAATLPKIDDKAASLFINRYTSLFSTTSTILAGMKIGFYQHSSVARDILSSVLQQLGAEVVTLERTDTFVPIDTEAVSKEDQQKGIEWSKQGFDALISTDGDGDRPLIGDENGVWLRGDVVGILCSEYLKASHVVTPVNSNTALESSDISKSIRTQIGSPYVIAGMTSLLEEASHKTRLVGYEANGGFLVGSNIAFRDGMIAALPTRDSFLPIILLLTYANEHKKPLSALSNHLPARYTASDRIKDVPTEKSQSLLSLLASSKEQQDWLINSFSVDETLLLVQEINQLDGLRMTLNNGEIVHLRPSGNAPELRCYAEAGSNERVKSIVNLILEMLETKIKSVTNH